VVRATTEPVTWTEWQVPLPRFGHRFGIAVMAAIALIVAAGCGDSPQASSPSVQRVASERLDELEVLDVVRERPAFATPIGGGRRDECHEPYFERREPATWREFQFEGTPDEVLSYYRARLTQDGWSVTREMANQGELPSVRFEKPLDGWVAAIRVTVIAAESTYDVVAEDATSRVCPAS
jgi:hypothetical protein